MSKVLCLLLVIPSICSGATVTVDLNGGADYTEIQPAIDDAEDGDTVLIRPGEYVIAAPVTLRGKWITLKGQDGPQTTIIEMSSTPADPLRTSVMTFENGETKDSVIENLTFTGGRGTQFCSGSCYLFGGGLFLVGNVAPTFINCIITRNFSPASGGGAYCRDGCAPTFRACTFSLNASGSLGGAFKCVADCAPQMIGCTFRRNASTGGMGGAVHCSWSSPVFSDCTFEGNSVQGGEWGGQGAALKIDDSSPRLDRCRILGNWAQALGGGIFLWHSTVYLNDCVIYGNLAGEAGAVVSHELASAVAVNCTVADNFGSWGAGFDSVLGGTATLTNCIVWGNTPNTVTGATEFCVTAEDPLLVSHGSYDIGNFELVDIQSVQYQVPNFLVQEPDFHLDSGSPCIDAGTAEGASTADIEGNPRPCGDGVDIGAYEFGNCRPSKTFRRGDANSDSAINVADPIFALGYLFASGDSPTCLDTADANDDGAVNVADAIATLGYLFAGTGPLAPPFDACGDDPTEDGLDCGSFGPCE